MIDTRVRAEDLFDSLGNEERQDQEEVFQIERNSALEEILADYRDFSKDIGRAFKRSKIAGKSTYSDFKAGVSNYTAKDITLFSIYLRKEDLKSKLGIAVYLNTLIRECHDENITIITKNWVTDLDNLGYEFYKKNIKVIGNLGINAGKKMNYGLIEVSGNVDSGAGYNMKNSKIIIGGNAYSRVGHEMISGEIHVKGDCDKMLGYHMENGEIIVEGNAGFGTGMGMAGGKIIVKGRVRPNLGLNAFGGSIYVDGEIENPLGRILERSRGVPGVNIFHKEKQIVKDGRILDDRYY